jgi:hypothetical protein
VEQSGESNELKMKRGSCLKTCRIGSRKGHKGLKKKRKEKNHTHFKFTTLAKTLALFA